MSVELEDCPYEGCARGEVTYCDFIDAKGRPSGARRVKCATCDGRGYLLPEPGVYAVEGAKSATVAVVTGEQPLLRSAEFVRYDWDLSTEFEVKWLHRFVPESSTTVDGSKG